MMRYLIPITFIALLNTAVVAQDTMAPIASPSSGEVQSNMPAATTGTAPIDSSMPSGTGTTGTSGTTMEEAAENNSDNSSLIWAAVLVAGLAGLIVYLRRKKQPR